MRARRRRAVDRGPAGRKRAAPGARGYDEDDDNRNMIAEIDGGVPKTLPEAKG
jgi:hypothetical protein